MSKQLQQDQDKKKKFEKKWKQDVAPPSKLRAEGATPGLPVLDYNTSRVDSRQFIEGAKQLLDYAAIHYGRVSYIFEYGREFDHDVNLPVKPTKPAVVAIPAAAAPIDPAAVPVPPAKTEEQEAYELELDRYKRRLFEHDKIVMTYKENLIKMYGVLYGQLTVAMRHKAQESLDYDRIREEKDLLSLWKLVKRLSLEERGTASHNVFKRIEDARQLFNRVKQFQSEKLVDFYERYLVEVSAAEACDVCFGNVSYTNELVDDGMDPEDARLLSREKELTMTFLSKIDKKRYGSILDEWENRLNDGEDIYPESLTDALQRFNNRKLDSKSIPGVAGQGIAFVATDGNQSQKYSKMQCFFCKQFGHRQADCPMLKQAYELFAKQKKGKDDKAAVAITVSEVCDCDEDQGFGFVISAEQEDLENHVYSSNVKEQCSFLKPTDLLCDNQATISIVHNKKLLKNLRKAHRPITVSGIAGKFIVEQVGDLGKFGEVYYHPDALANILCFHDLARRYHVTYDSNVLDAFIVTTDVRTLVFEPKGKLYVYNPLEAKASSEVVLIQTVSENEKTYTKRELEYANKAKDLYIKLARPGLNDFIRLVRDGKVLNCPVTVADIHRWIAIYGVEEGTLKGRSVRKRPDAVVIEESIAKQSETQSVVVAADICFIEGVIFLVGISRKINLITVHNLPSREAKDVMPVIRKLQSLYKEKGFRVDTILFDGEGSMKHLKPVIGDLGIKLNTASKGEHVPEVERAIRQIKERCRSIINTVPYPMDDLLITHMVYFCVRAINMIPRSDSTESPKEMFTGVKIDFNRDCKIEFGAYVQVHEDEEITNTMKARTAGAIALGPVGNAQGSYQFLNLSTWKVIQRRTWHELPMPKEVIQFIEEKTRPTVVQKNEAKMNAAVENRIIEEIEDLILQRNEQLQEAAHGIANDDERNQDGRVHFEDNDGEEAALVTTTGVEAQRQRLLAQLDILETFAKVERAIALTTMSVRVGINKHGTKAMLSLFEEFQQLFDKEVFEPMDPENLSIEQKRRILRTLIFMKEKRDGRLKSRLCVDGSKQTVWDSCVDPASPTVLIESIFLSIIIDAVEERCVKMADIEGAYLIADMPEEVLVMFDEMMTAAMLQVAPHFKDHVSRERLILKLKKALYGCIQSARLFYEHLRKTLCGLGFEPNPYDGCVFNKTMYGVQCTVLIYVDDLKVSCKDPRGVDDTLADLTKVYKKLAIKEGKKMDYLGMELDFGTKGVVQLSMAGLIEEVFLEYPVDEKKVSSPAAHHLFEVNELSEKLPGKEKESFHSAVAKLLYIAKRARPDILLAVSFLTTRVQAPDRDDQKKLARIINYLMGTRGMVLTLGADDLTQLHAFIDASHAVHEDAKSHTGVVTTFGKGALFCKSSKQKLVSKSSTAAELIALSDGIDYVMWAQEFMKSQGFDMKPVIVHQDNKSTIVLAEKGKSTSQRTRHINIRYFAVKDMIDRGEVQVVYTPTEDMVADYFTKPLQGKLFNVARSFIMCDVGSVVTSQGCVVEQTSSRRDNLKSTL